MRFLPTHFVLSVERKNVTYREQRHRLSSARLFARREGRDRRARDRFHGALLLQALGLGDRRFRGQEHGGLDDRSHFIRSGAECAYLYADFRSSCPPFQKQHLENRRSFSSRVFLFLAFFKFLKGDRRFEIFFFVSFFVQVGFHHLALLREGGVSKKSNFCDTLN